MPRVSTLIRNKPLRNGVELEWSTFSQIPVTNYRLRYRNLTEPEDMDWEELDLKARNVTELPFTYNHVHQVHGLRQHQDYELTIESLNAYGWSQPLTVKFTTTGEGKLAASGSNLSAPFTGIVLSLCSAVGGRFRRVVGVTQRCHMVFDGHGSRSRYGRQSPLSQQHNFLCTIKATQQQRQQQKSNQTGL